MPAEYTDSAGCVRRVTVSLEAGLRVERDLLTRQGHKHWNRRVEAVRKRTAKGAE